MKEKLSSDKVYTFIGNRIKTTQEIADHFGARSQQAAAAVAILRIKGTVRPANPPKDEEGISRWQRV